MRTCSLCWGLRPSWTLLLPRIVSVMPAVPLNSTVAIDSAGRCTFASHIGQLAACSRTCGATWLVAHVMSRLHGTLRAAVQCSSEGVHTGVWLCCGIVLLGWAVRLSLTAA